LLWMWEGATITVLASIALDAIAIVLTLFGGSAIFGDSDYAPIFLAIAAAQILVGFGNLALAYFSGIGDNRTFAIVQIVANILALLLVVALTESMGLAGAVLGVVVPPATVGAVALWRFFRPTTRRGMFRIARDRPRLKGLLSYAAAMGSSVAALPLSQLLIRIDISEHLGWQAVGYWQAVAKISEAYMLFVSVILINYLLPQLSSRQESGAALRMLFGFGALLLGVFIMGCGAIYAVRDYLLTIVYSQQFLVASDFVLPQLVGETFKVATLLLYYYFMSRDRVLIVFIAELALGVALYLLYLLLAPSYGTLAPIYAYALAYAGLLLIMIGLLPIARGRVRSSS